MANFNRLKLVLVEKDRQANGSQSNLASQLVLLANGARIQFNQT